MSASLDIRCSVCGTLDWVRAMPGSAPTSEVYADTNVLAFSDDGVAPVAWCLTHDPLLIRSVA